MLPKLHALAKTSIELRRGINRLLQFRESNPEDVHVVNGDVDRTIAELKEARRHVPAQFLDTDLMGEA